MKRFVEVVLWCGILFLVLVSAYNIFLRIQWQRNNSTVEFFLDVEDSVYFSPEKSFFFSEVKSLGIKTIVISWDEQFFSKVEIIKSFGFKVGIKVLAEKECNFEKLNNFIKENKSIVETVVFEPVYYKGSNVYNISAKFLLPEVGNIVKENGLVCLNFEFSKYVLGRMFNVKDKVVRTFILDINTMDEDYLLKIKKAVRERSCKVIYIYDTIFLGSEKKLKILREIMEDNKNIVGDNNYQKYETIYAGWVSVFVVYVLHIFGILFTIKRFTKKIETIEINFFQINIVTFLVGLISYGLLQHHYYVVLNRELPGVKLIFVLPLIITSISVLGKEQLRKVLYYNLKIRDVIYLVILIISGYYVLSRMSNVNKQYVLQYEIMLRNFIENIILFRPRFKEVFFGHPLLVYSLYLLKSDKENLLGKVLLCFSVIGQVSVLNTFLHIHTPIQISVFRTITGMILGLIIGEFFVLISKKVGKFYVNK